MSKVYILVLQFIETLIKLEYNSTCEVRQQVSDKFECLRDPGDKFERCTNRIDREGNLFIGAIQEEFGPLRQNIADNGRAPYHIGLWHLRALPGCLIRWRSVLLLN
jgi:hypothetical protein